MPRLF